MQTYNIIIDEDQRAHLVRALAAAKLPTNPDNDSVHLLLELLQGLPGLEKENPRITHGLCL